MFSVSQTSRPVTVTAPSTRARTAVGPRLLAVAAAGLLSLTACSSADGAGEGGASSSPNDTSGSSGSSAVQESASQDTGAIDPGAADEAWKEQARKVASKRSGVDATKCVDGLLDQKTLDGVATAIPEIAGLSMSGLYTHIGCDFTATDPADEDLLQAAAEVEIRRYYLANDEEFKTLDASGYLKHGQCADDVETDENGVSTVNKHGVKESKIPGPSIAAVQLQAAWHCSEDGTTTSAVLIHAAEGEEDRFSDPTVLTEPDLAVEMAAHLYDAEADWAPEADEIYQKNFEENMGQ